MDTECTQQEHSALLLKDRENLVTIGTTTCYLLI